MAGMMKTVLDCSGLRWSTLRERASGRNDENGAGLFRATLVNSERKSKWQK